MVVKMTKEEISALIAEKIKPNGKGEITAEVLAEVLDAMNNSSQCYEMPSDMADYFDGTPRTIEDWEALGMDFTGIISGKYSSIWWGDMATFVTIEYLTESRVRFHQMSPLDYGEDPYIIREYFILQFDSTVSAGIWQVTYREP